MIFLKKNNIMEKQVLSIEKMQHLQELGLDTSEASMCWRRMIRDFRGEEKNGRWSLVINQPIIVSNFETYEEVPAFTLQDILEMLPSTINNNDDEYWLEFGVGELDKSDWYIQYKSVKTISVLKYISNNTSIDAAYEILCWCIENKYI